MNTPITWLLVNTASGSNSDEATQAVTEALAGAGAAPARVVDIKRDGCPSRADLEAAGVATLVVFAGDGTVNAALTTIEGWDGAVLVLPGGTMNLLAKAVHGDRDAAEIAGELASLKPIHRCCIRSSQGTATIELLAGPGATWSDVREEMREGAIAGMADRAVEAVRQSTGGAMVRVIEPAVGREEGYAGVRLEPQADVLSADGYGAQGITDYVKQGIALLRRDFREGPHDELGHFAEVTCASIDGSPIELMIDGERRTGGPRETFSLAPLGVNLLASGNG
jgi:hypothetical protein